MRKGVVILFFLVALVIWDLLTWHVKTGQVFNRLRDQPLLHLERTKRPALSLIAALIEESWMAASQGMKWGTEIGVELGMKAKTGRWSDE